MFVHLHTHSHFSFLRGLASPLELATAAADLGMPALALTDRELLTGSVEFFDACRTMGVRPILGLEIPVELPTNTLVNHQHLERATGNRGQPPGDDCLVLLAMNMDGWSNLCRLSSSLQLSEKKAISYDLLSANSADLVCLTGGRRGLAANRLIENPDGDTLSFFSDLQSIYSDRFFIELQCWSGAYRDPDQKWAKGLIRVAQKLKLSIVATNAIHYLAQDRHRLQRVVSAIRTNLALTGLSDDECALPGSYFMNEAAMLDSLQGFPIDNPKRLLENSVNIADRCRVDLPVGQTYYPTIELADGADPYDILRQRAENGAIRIYGGMSPEILERLNHELEIIHTCGYASLFLIMEEILDHARQIGVPVSSRGSAASSLVAHCLGITTPDPVRLNLYFERFLNPVRATPPDIDTDLCSRRRDQVINFVYQRYGNDRVAMVATISRLRSRSALRAVAKAYGLSSEKISRLLEKLPHRWFGPESRENDGEDAYANLSNIFSTPEYAQIISDAQELLGTPDHLSIHPGGIIIAPGPITDRAPLTMAPKGLQITQFDLVSIERLGLLKIDLLGIRGLTVLGDVAESIMLSSNTNERSGVTGEVADGRALQSPVLKILEAIPEEDLQTSETVRTAQTIGCFQIESPGMRATLREIQASSIDDIMAALALYRPGPLTGGLKDAFVERFKANAAAKIGIKNNGIQFSPEYYLHPALQPLLQETYGVILYQEQVLRIANELAGFSLADADLLRRAMSHFDLDKQMQTLMEKFVTGAYQRSAVTEAVAIRVWEQMAAFAGYGFPKAHAASYAQIAWRAAWCKTYYPALFMASVLANWGGYYSQRVYLTEARRLGLSVMPPHVNYARIEFSLSYIDQKPVLFMGLGQVKDLTQRTIKRIQAGQPFTSLSDFMIRVDPKPIEAQNLVRSGCLDGFGSLPTLLLRIGTERWQAGQLQLFPDDLYANSIIQGDSDWSLAEKVAAQEEILGASLAAHPLDLVAKEIAASGALSTVEAAANPGRQVKIVGMRQTWRRSRAPKGGVIYFMSLEDLEGMLNVIIPGEVFQRYRTELSGAGPYLVEGLVDFSHSTNEPVLRATRIQILNG